MAQLKTNISERAPLLGIEIGGTKLQLVIGDATGAILQRQRYHIDAKAGADGILAQLREGIANLTAKHQPRAIGVGYGGPIDCRTGRIWRSYHIEGWTGFPLADWLRDETGLPVMLDNDGNVAALGEAHHGAGRGYDSVVYVTLGSGVGAGLVLRGCVYHGVSPGEMELGHVRLSEAGMTVQDRCSGWAVDALVRDAAKHSPASLLAKSLDQDASGRVGGEAKHLAAAIHEGCPVATEILGSTMRQLALALSHVIHLIHPQIIIIGGGLSLIGEPLRESLARAIPPFLMDAFTPGPAIAIAALAEDAVPVGALTLAATGERKRGA